jgi:predicted permease
MDRVRGGGFAGHGAGDMSIYKRLRYLLPGFRRAEELEMQEELQSIAGMAEPGELGNLTLAAERRREVWGWTWLEQWFLDVRHAARTLRHNPMFTVAALLTLAIGIGANAAVFSVINGVLLKPLNFPKPEELVAVRQNAPGAAGLANFVDGLHLSASQYFTYSEQNRTFQSLGVWIAGNANVTGLAEPEQVRTVLVSNGVLQALDVPPEAGRWLLAGDFIPHGAANAFGGGISTTVMLSHGYWQRHFGGDRSAIGRTITVDSRPFEIVGVMPEGFRVVNAEADVIMPLAFDRGKVMLAGFAFHGIGRLKPAVTLTQADADLARLVPVWRDSWTNGHVGDGLIYASWKIAPALRPLKEEVVGSVSDLLWVVMATIGLVMLIACANVTNLMLVRAEVRQQELALRTALGAGRGRIVRALIVESVMLGLMGGVLGVALCAWGVRLLLAVHPANLPRLNEISVDFRTLGFILALSVLSGLLFGLIPALKYAGPRISLALRSAGRTASVSRERHRARSFLVVAQVALALVLLVSAGLMIRTFQALGTVEPGFTHAQQLQTVRIAIPTSLIPQAERVTRVQNDIADKLASIPGVTSVGFASVVPMDGTEPDWDNIYAEGKVYPDNVIPPLRFFKYVSPGFFHATGTRIIAGRELTWNEVNGLRPVALVSENLARELWGAPSAAVGKRFRRYIGMPWQEVIGVVQDVRENGIQEPAPLTVYWPTIVPAWGPFPLDVQRTVTFAIRSDRAGTEGFLNEVRQAIWSVNSNLPVAAVRTMQDLYDQSVARTSFTLVILGIAGAMALALGIVGIYGVISYSVSQRSREIGIRLALGAQQGELKRMFVSHGLVLASIGVGIGLVAAAGLMRLMKSLLFGISPLDPLTYASVPFILAVATVLASYLPARRAAAVDPVEALRAE